jgi:hypothetical protein
MRVDAIVATRGSMLTVGRLAMVVMGRGMRGGRRMSNQDTWRALPCRRVVAAYMGLISMYRGGRNIVVASEAVYVVAWVAA